MHAVAAPAEAAATNTTARSYGGMVRLSDGSADPLAPGLADGGIVGTLVP
jgi:hypothetical protein